jgi:hypothetical protein
VPHSRIPLETLRPEAARVGAIVLNGQSRHTGSSAGSEGPEDGAPACVAVWLCVHAISGRAVIVPDKVSTHSRLCAHKILVDLGVVGAAPKRVVWFPVVTASAAQRTPCSLVLALTAVWRN